MKSIKYKEYRANWIANRIQAEYDKHADSGLPWATIAALKIKSEIRRKLLEVLDNVEPASSILERQGPACNHKGSCPKGCKRNHTHKTFFCEKCEPERYKPESQPECDIHPSGDYDWCKAHHCRAEDCQPDQPKEEDSEI